MCPSVKIVRTGHTLAKIKNVKNDDSRFIHLPFNCAIVKIAFLDLDLFLEVKILIFYISETVKGIANMCETQM